MPRYLLPDYLIYSGRGVRVVGVGYIRKHVQSAGIFAIARICCSNRRRAPDAATTAKFPTGSL